MGITSANDGGDLPVVGPNATKGQLGEALVEAAILDLHQLYDRRAGLDFGVDGLIELTTDGPERRATGKLIGVQVKRGLSNAVKTRYGFTHYCTEAHANYWLGHSLPIIVVHSEPSTGHLRWQHVSAETLRRTPKGFAIDLPLQSDLRSSLNSIRALTEGRRPIAQPAGRTFILPYSMNEGVRVDDVELGLAALEFSRAAMRGETGSIEVEVEEEPNLVAIIDAIRDCAAPSAKQRLDAIVCEDILARCREQSGKLKRALTLLLTEKWSAEAFGYQDQLLANAIRRLTVPRPRSREPGDVALQAWPTYGVTSPLIQFDVPGAAMEELYAKDDFNRIAIRMGEAGGTMVFDLNPDVTAERFLPALALGLVDFAEASGLLDNQAIAEIGVLPSTWLIGMA